MVIAACTCLALTGPSPWTVARGPELSEASNSARLLAGLLDERASLVDLLLVLPQIALVQGLVRLHEGLLSLVQQLGGVGGGIRARHAGCPTAPRTG